MKTWKLSFSILLVVVTALFIRPGTKGGAALAENASAAGVTDSLGAQISLIENSLEELRQNSGMNPWYYCVADFDHNGRLEFFAASQHPADRSTNLKVWEVNSDGTALDECEISKEADESFPDIISDTADAYHITGTDTWAYLFYDNVVLSPTDVYTSHCSVSLKDGVIGYRSHAIEHSEMVNSYRYVTHMDINGFPISAEQYNALATDAFAGAERSSVNFDWFPAEELSGASRLTESYEVFAGIRQAPANSPIAPPAIMQHDDLQPVIGTEGEVNATYLVITKNPSSERKKAGKSLTFTAAANVYDSADWTFVSPDGGEYDLPYFEAHFVYSAIDGAYSPVLTIRNLDEYMDGWGAYCTFYFKGQTARTSTAWMDIR